MLLKRDVFSTVERGRFRDDAGEVDAVLRRLDQVPLVVLPLARHLFARERRALAWRATSMSARAAVGRAPCLVRGFIDGVALHLAKPHGDLAYFRSAKRALRRLHRAGICHNDLAKEQNWLRGSDGRAYVTDFQLAACFKTRSRLFRIAAYEDLRHLLKHKRSYAPEALTPLERKFLARKSFAASIWLATGKKVYQAITRGLFNFTDREGGGRRLVNDAPVLIELIRKNPGCATPPSSRSPTAAPASGSTPLSRPTSRAGKAVAQRIVRRQGVSRRSTSRSCTRCRATPPASRAPRSCNSSP